MSMSGRELGLLGMLERLPDEPRFVEPRALLLSGTCDLAGTRDGFLLVSRILPIGAWVGAVEPHTARDALASVPSGFELVVQDEDVDDARAALPGWAAVRAILHVQPDAHDEPEEGAARGVDVRVVAPPDAASVLALPEEWRVWAIASEALSLVRAGGRVVTLCHTLAVTETLWDVRVDTLAGHRRKGYARVAYLALSAYMRALGRRAVWGAHEGNTASLSLARSLGFRPVQTLWVLGAPGVRSR